MIAMFYNDWWSWMIKIWHHINQNHMTYNQFTQQIADYSDLIEFACFNAVST